MAVKTWFLHFVECQWKFQPISWSTNAFLMTRVDFRRLNSGPSIRRKTKKRFFEQAAEEMTGGRLTDEDNAVAASP